MRLTYEEQKKYNEIVTVRIAQLRKGTIYKPSQFFPGEPTSPRICRKIYEEVTNGNLTSLKLAGAKSCDGYFVL